MSDKNTLEWLVAKMTAMEKELKEKKDGRFEAWTDLLMSIETRLSEVMDNKETAADVIEKMATAMKSMTPVNNFNPTIKVEPTPYKISVQPTPITMECTVPQAPPAQVVFQERERKPGKWKISMMTHNGPREMTVEQLA